MATYNDKILVPNSAKDGLDTIHPETNTGNVYDFNSNKWLDELLADNSRFEEILSIHESKIASTTELGHVKVDGTSISVDGTGTIKTVREIGEWIDLPTTNGWKVSENLQIRKEGDMVRIYGSVIPPSPVAGSIFTLPLEYRPKSSLYSVVYGSSSTYSINILSNGSAFSGNVVGVTFLNLTFQIQG